MSTPQKLSQEENQCCLVCGYLDLLKKGVCLQCWGWSAIGHYIDSIKELLKQGEQR